MNGYVVDGELKQEKHRTGLNDWDSYLPEIADELGIRASEVQIPLTAEKLAGMKYLMMGERNMEAEAGVLKNWINEGGTLILFGTTGTGECTGFTGERVVKQTDDDFTTSAYISLTSQYAKNVYNNDGLKTLPVYSDCVCVETGSQTKVLAWLHRPTIFGLEGGDKTEYPAICEIKSGKGMIYYFAVSIPKTIWVLQQGKPVDRDYDGDGYYRTGDAIVLTRAHDLNIPYGDIYREILKDMFSRIPQPMIYEMPVDENGQIPDFLLHYGGDDESSDDYQMIASRVMREKGLPYHVNLMLKQEGRFAITKEQYGELKENGTTPSIHFDFFAARKFYTKEEFERQLDAYVEAFGEVPKVSVNHVLMWTGWVDHERWCMERGIKADHTKVHKHLMPDYNPINTFGMAFGGTYPHFVYDDCAHENKKMEFLDIPVGFFEPRVYTETEAQDKEQINKVLEIAYRHKAALDIFVHPIYLATEPACIAALDYIKERVATMQYHVMHVNTDFVCDWWYDRSAIQIKEIESRSEACEFETESERAFVVQIKTDVDVYYVNDEEKKAESINRNGADWKLLTVPAGKNNLKMERRALI